jgi:hypothetical protein
VGARKFSNISTISLVHRNYDYERKTDCY